LKDSINGFRPEIHQYNILKFAHFLTENTLFLQYVDKPDNGMQGNNFSLFWTPCDTHMRRRNAVFDGSSSSYNKTNEMH